MVKQNLNYDNELQGNYKMDDVEVGDKIVFKLPVGEFAGEETIGGVGDISELHGETVLKVKAGAWYTVTEDEFVSIEEKDAY